MQEKEPYFGSVRFFKNLILLAVIIMITLPAYFAVHYKIKYDRLSEAQQLYTETSETKETIKGIVKETKTVTETKAVTETKQNKKAGTTETSPEETEELTIKDPTESETETGSIFSIHKSKSGETDSDEPIIEIKSDSPDESTVEEVDSTDSVVIYDQDGKVLVIL